MPYQCTTKDRIITYNAKTKITRLHYKTGTLYFHYNLTVR